MSSVVISGDTSGAITLAAPAIAGTNTLTLPANTGTVITTASSGQSIPSAALPAGSVLQVVNATTSTETSSQSSSYADTTLTASITPLFSTSKILVLVNQGGCGNLTSCYLDSPATTSSTTYKTQFASGSNNQTVYVQAASGGVNSTSTITLMEIAA
jgi:hypothetical protein